MVREGTTLDETGTDDVEADALPHKVTVVGGGVPASFELTVDGEIESVEAAPVERTAVVSRHAVEGTIEVGVTQFRFSGELANVRLLGGTGLGQADSPSSPTIHVEYGHR